MEDIMIKFFLEYCSGRLFTLFRLLFFLYPSFSFSFLFVALFLSLFLLILLTVIPIPDIFLRETQYDIPPFSVERVVRILR